MLRVSAIPTAGKVFYSVFVAVSLLFSGAYALADPVTSAPLPDVRHAPVIQEKQVSNVKSVNSSNASVSALPQTITLDHPMRFRLMRTQNVDYNQSVWIAAEGLITSATASQFEDFVRQYRLQNAKLSVRLHSGGGHLLAGLKLGRIIRDLGYHTEIGRSVGLSKDGYKRKGRCASSCAYAFLGGVVRQASEQELGIHRYGFRERSTGRVVARTAIEASSRQVIDMLLASYMRDMNVHEGFLVRAMNTPFETMYYFKDEELVQFALSGRAPQPYQHDMSSLAVR
jgi:hypothetical protein